MAMTAEEVLSMNDEVEESLQTHIEIQIKKEVLQNILKRVERSKEKKGAMPIKQGVYLFFSEDSITARAINSDFSTQVVVQKNKDNYTILDGTSGGAVFMDAKFSSMVNSLPRKNIKIAIDGLQAIISAGRSSFELSILDHLEFPRFLDNIEGPEITLHTDILKRMYAKTIFATSSVETRPSLTGVNHEIKNNKLRLVSTDSHRLAQVHHQLDDEVEDISKIIPSPALNEIQKQLDDSVTEVTICFAETSVSYRFDNGTTIISRVIDANYPQTDRLIPDSYVTEIQYRVEDLRDLVKRAMLVDQEHPVKFLVQAEQLKTRMVSREADKAGFVEDISPLKGEGKDILLGFNIRYLLDTLNHHSPSSVIKMQFVSNMRPFLIRLADGDDDNLDLILPVRLIDAEMNSAIEIEDFRDDTQIEIKN